MINILLYVLGFFRETKPIGYLYIPISIHLEINRGLLWGIGSSDCAGWDVPWSAIWELKTQRSRWHHSFWVQRPENQGRGWRKSQSGARGRWDVPALWVRQQKGTNSSFLWLLFCWWHCVQPHWGGQTAWPVPPNQMVISSADTLTGRQEMRFNLVTCGTLKLK